MSGSSYGTLFKITTWGESHGLAVGVVIDGCPAGLPLSPSDIQPFMNRRKPGQSKFTTPRKEDDVIEILSGVFEGQTTGTPISLMVRNENQRSRDYGDIATYYRPGHADYTFDTKYGIRDYRGGGRSSGRETIGRVAAGAIASLILEKMGIKIQTFTKSIGPVVIHEKDYDYSVITENALYMPNTQLAKEAQDYLTQCMKNQDSSGGMIECRVTGMPAGIGEPVFDKLDAQLSKALFSIGAVKGVEIGDGFKVASLKGSENNDGFTNQNGITKVTNHSGGVLGGMSDGSELILRAAIKPTPSISASQETVTTDGKPKTVSITGRHDPVIVPRAVVVVESMVAVTLVDLLMENMSSKLDSITDYYSKTNE